MAGARVSRLSQLVRRDCPGYLHLAEVADELGIARQSLVDWRAEGLPQAQESAQALIEGRWVYLYDLDAVERLRRFVSRRRAGRLTWSKTELRDRNSRRHRALSAERQSHKLRKTGRPVQAALKARIARELRAGLVREAQQKGRNTTSVT